jgi:putative ABC transport system permease protein
MIKFQLKIFIRNLIQKPLYPVIGIVVLSIGIACLMLISVWAADELSYDKSYKDADRIYRISIEFKKKNGYNTHIARSYYEWLRFIKTDISGIEDYARFIKRNQSRIMTDSLNSYNANVLRAKNDFLKMFSIQIISGETKNALEEPNTAIITEKAALKFFGKTNPIGKYFREFQKNDKDGTEFKIIAIAKDLPSNSHFHFELALAMSKKDTIDGNWYYNYIKLEKGVKPSQVLSQFHKVARKYVSTEEASELIPHLQKVTDIHLNSSLDRELEENGSKKQLILLCSLAAFVFFISMLNFINLQHVIFLKQRRNLNIFQYSGARFTQILWGKVLETSIYGVITILIGMVIFESFQKQFNLLLGKSADAGNNIVFPLFLILIPAILFIISFSGLISAYFFKVKRIVFSSITSKNRTLKTLITLQYIFSKVLLITIFVVNKQIRFFMNCRLGNQQNNIVCIKETPIQIDNKYNILKSELLKNPVIHDVTSSFENPSDEIVDMMPIKMPGLKEQKMLYVYPVDYNFFDFYNIDIVAGRDFKEFHGDNSVNEDFILNECALENLGLTKEEALEKPFDIPFGMNDTSFFKGGKIVGIVKDFQMSSMKNKIKPYVFFQKSFWLFSVQVKYDSSHLNEASQLIKNTWQKLYPGFPYECDYVEDLYAGIYKNEIQLKNLSMALGIIAMLLSCLGLWGITGIIYEIKTKEIGIRKANGAKTFQIMQWLLKDVVLIVFVALLIAIPISYYLLQQWLNNFAYKIKIDWSIFAVAGMVALFIAIATVCWQSWKAARRNPVESLRYE